MMPKNANQREPIDYISALQKGDLIDEVSLYGGDVILTFKPPFCCKEHVQNIHSVLIDLRENNAEFKRMSFWPPHIDDLSICLRLSAEIESSSAEEIKKLLVKFSQESVRTNSGALDNAIDPVQHAARKKAEQRKADEHNDASSNGGAIDNSLAYNVMRYWQEKRLFKSVKLEKNTVVMLNNVKHKKNIVELNLESEFDSRANYYAINNALYKKFRRLDLFKANFERPNISKVENPRLFLKNAERFKSAEEIYDLLIKIANTAKHPSRKKTASQTKKNASMKQPAVDVAIATNDDMPEDVFEMNSPMAEAQRKEDVLDDTSRAVVALRTMYDMPPLFDDTGATYVPCFEHEVTSGALYPQVVPPPDEDDLEAFWMGQNNSL